MCMYRQSSNDYSNGARIDLLLAGDRQCACIANRQTITRMVQELIVGR